MRAIVVGEYGDADVLHEAEVPDPTAQPGQVVVGVTHAGVNYVDVYHRTGLYPHDFPFVLGQEGAGEIVSIGADVEGFAVGQRVAWTDVIGSYAELLAAPAGRLVPLPDAIGNGVAAAAMLQGLTARYLVNDTFPLQPGDRCLIHAGAGGVGRLLIQLAKGKGAVVFATVGSAKKAATASSAGADHVIDYVTDDFAAAVEAVAGPHALAVVYDGVGAATFDRGLGLLRRRGMMVTYGNASGPVTPVDPLRLSRGGSLYLTRPTLGDHIADTETLRTQSSQLFSAITSGRLDVMIGGRYPLASAAEAHRDLEGRRTTGKVLLEV